MWLDELQPCLTGQAIAHQTELQSEMALFKQLISAPKDVYEQLYLTTLYALMELCQAMPHDMAKPVPYSFFVHQLTLSATVLKQRRGKMLPLQADSETIAAQEPLWTYALFTAGLLWELDRIQHIGHIELYKSTSEQLGTWHPIAGNLAEPYIFYKITAQKQALILNKQVFQPVMIGKIVPTVALRWLSAHPTIFQLWWDVIAEQAHADNPLHLFINEALVALGFEDTASADASKNQANAHTQMDEVKAEKKKEEEEEKQEEQEAKKEEEKKKKNKQKSMDAAQSASTDHKHIDAVTVLNDWLITQHDTFKTSENVQPAPLYLRVPQGLFITLEAIEHFLQTHRVFPSSAQLLNTLYAALEKHPEHSNPTLFYYRPCNFANKIRLAGVILSETHLPEALKTIAIQKDYMPANAI